MAELVNILMASGIRWIIREEAVRDFPQQLQLQCMANCATFKNIIYSICPELTLAEVCDILLFLSYNDQPHLQDS